MEEIWRPISCLPGMEVSSLGNIRSWLTRNPPKIVTQQDNGHGYRYIKRRIEGKQRSLYVHRLVAVAFIPNPQNLPEINHLNECKDDNRVDNLEWISHRDNCRYGTRNQRLSENHSGVNGCLYGLKKSAETRRKIGDAHRGKHLSEETKRMIGEKASLRMQLNGNPFKGKHHTEETKLKLSLANKGKFSGINNPMYGKNVYAGKSEEELAAIREKKRATYVARHQQKLITGDIKNEN